jgi:signal recognition particle receptor subunit beta
MVLFNHATREMTAKIVYYGPGLCGKTTNLMVVFDQLDPQNRGKMLSLATRTDRTLFFDLLPVNIGKVGPFNFKIQLYTVPGQVFYNETRKLVLKGADAVVFVVDSQPSMLESNRQSFQNLLENLQTNGIDPSDTPIVIQYNKRDLPGVTPVSELSSNLGFESYRGVEASALNGDGVMETFHLVSKITARHLIARLQGKASKPTRSAVEAKGELAATTQESGVPSGESAPEEQVIGFSADLHFADSFEREPVERSDDSEPFPLDVSDEARYDHVEEISIDQLLEGRERPATLRGEQPLPFIAQEPDPISVPVESEDGDVDSEEIEELEASELLMPSTEEIATERDPIEIGEEQVIEIDQEPVIEIDQEQVIESAAAAPSLATFSDTRLRILEQRLEQVERQNEKIVGLLSDFVTGINHLIDETRRD